MDPSDDTSNFICPDCGYAAPGPNVYRFHIRHVDCVGPRHLREKLRRAKKEAAVLTELERLIQEQAADDKRHTIYDPKVYSIYRSIDDGVTLADVLDDEGRLWT